MRRSGRFPRGWNAARVARVLAHYEEQTESEVVAEDEAAFGRLTETTMRVPVKLVPKVRELIAKLQEASEEAVREGRNGNKNNAEFVLKNVQINDLIERLKSGHKVDPSEIDQAFEPARVL